jgi:RNA methyltransferase, TrmH family
MMITSIDNPRVKEARKLQQRRHRYKTGTFLIEGMRLVDDALQSKAHLREVYFAPELIENQPGGQHLLTRLLDSGVECVACSTAVLISLTETVTPQGIAAVATMPQLPVREGLTLVVVLDGVRDPGNAGTLLRAGEAAGVELAVLGPETVDPFNDKVVRAAMVAHFRLPLRVCSTWPAIQQILPAAIPYYVAQAHAPLAYDLVNWRTPAVLIIGGEAAGASSMAHEVAQPVAIPMQGQVESLNAAIAGAVILFEAARQRRHQRNIA